MGAPINPKIEFVVKCQLVKQVKITSENKDKIAPIKKLAGSNNLKSDSL